MGAVYQIYLIESFIRLLVNQVITQLTNIISL